jgi:hypothetical protein
MTTMSFDRNLLLQFASEIQEYDVKLDEGAGSKSAGKRAIKNRLAENSTVDVSGILGWFDQLSDISLRAAAFVKFEKAFNDKFAPAIEAFIESQVTPSDGAKLSDEELATLETERRESVKKFNAMRDLWKLLNPTDDLSDIPEPKKRTGSRGPRGPRAISSYQFAVDGTELSAANNTLAHIASLQDGFKVKDLRAYVIEKLSTEDKKFDFKTPPESFSFTLPNGMSVYASKMAEPAADDDDDEDSDDND